MITFETKKTIYKILNISSFIILIIAYGFVMAQSIINIIYSANNKKEIIVERLVYEQFSHEVYSNINSKVIKSFSYDTSCGGDSEIYSLPVKMEAFYDCTNVYNDNIDKDICQNKITSAYLCCNKECCTNVITGKKEYKKCNDKKEIDQHDERDGICSKFSKYNGKSFYKQNNNNKICVEKCDVTYYDLLKNSDRNADVFKIDSKNHYYHDYSVLGSVEYTNPIMVQNLLSVVKPSYFEMESNIKLSIMLNKNNYNEDKIKKKIRTLSEISAKNIYDTFNDEKCLGDQCYDDKYYFYDSFSSLSLSSFIEKNSGISLIFENFKNNQLIRNQEAIWYYRTYIGFENISELDRFKEHFDSNNHKNNSLYRISDTLYPNYGSFIIGAIICIISIILICLYIKDFKSSEINFKFQDYDYNINLFKFLLILALFLIYLLMYLFGYYYKFEEIHIDMEDFYQKVLEKYNYRRKQLYLLIGVIIFGFNVFLELIIQNFNFSLYHSAGNGFNGVPVNTIIVYFVFENVPCKHKRKLYKNKIFKDEFHKLEKKIINCRKCKDRRNISAEIEDYFIGNKKINEDQTINANEIKDQDEITIKLKNE